MKQLWRREKQKHLLAFLGLLWNKVAVTLRCPLWVPINHVKIVPI